MSAEWETTETTFDRRYDLAKAFALTLVSDSTPEPLELKARMKMSVWLADALLDELDQHQPAKKENP